MSKSFGWSIFENIVDGVLNIAKPVMWLAQQWMFWAIVAVVVLVIFAVFIVYPGTKLVVAGIIKAIFGV